MSSHPWPSHFLEWYKIPVKVVRESEYITSGLSGASVKACVIAASSARWLECISPGIRSDLEMLGLVGQYIPMADAAVLYVISFADPSVYMWSSSVSVMKGLTFRLLCGFCLGLTGPVVLL